MKRPKEIKIEYQIKYESLRRLVLSAFLLGQETGLKGMMYDHPLAEQYRKGLVDLITDPTIDKESRKKI